MSTTADKLMYLNETKKEIRDAIVEKGEDVLDADTFRSYADKIRAIQSGNMGSKDVNFYDYDGTLLYSYTVAEFAAVTELPTPPSRDRLVFQRWNWSLADIKAHGRAVNVGANYVTASGKSEFDLAVTNTTILTVTLRISADSSNTVTVDWGDGTSDESPGNSPYAASFTHTYENTGEYTVSVDSTGTYGLFGASTTPYNMFNVTPAYICRAVRLGARCTSIGSNAFRNCYAALPISIPESVTNISSDAFYYSYSLPAVVIPDGITYIGEYAFSSCYSLRCVSLPATITRIDQYAFYSCYSLRSLTIPENVTSIGTYAFYRNYSLVKYTMLPQVPPTIGSTGTFIDINKSCIIEVPKGSLEAYKTTTNLVTYANYMREAE